MSDLISRKALCEYALNTIDKTVSPNDIMRFPSAEPEQRWIPATEALPEEHERVLVTIKRSDGEKRVRSGNYYSEYFWIDNGDYWKCNHVLAWMPLPEAWKGE